MAAKLDRFCLPASRCVRLAEEILDQVPPLVEFSVQPQRQRPPWVLRDHDLCAALVEVGNDGIAVEGLVGDRSAEGDSVDQRTTAYRIETVAGQQDEAYQLPSASVSASILVVMPPLEGRSPWFCVPLLRPDRGDGF